MLPENNNTPDTESSDTPSNSINQPKEEQTSQDISSVRPVIEGEMGNISPQLIYPNTNVPGGGSLQPVQTPLEHQNINENFIVQPKKSRKKFIIVSATLIISLIYLGFGGYLLLRSNKSEKTSNTALKVEYKNSYDSPLGFLPPFQNNKVSAGEFTIKMGFFGETTDKIEKSGDFQVDKDGKVSFKMIDKINTVNSLLTYQVDRDKPGQDVGQDELDRYNITKKSMVASEYMRIGFIDLFGLDELMDDLDLFVGFFLIIEKEQRSKSCDNAYRVIKNILDDGSLNTGFLNPTARYVGDKYMVAVDSQKIDGLHTALIDFLSYCESVLSANTPDFDRVVEMYGERKNYINNITYSFIEAREGVWRLNIDQKDPNSDISAKELIQIEVKNLIYREPMIPVDSGSIRRAPNIYGLTYDYCRVPPIATSSFGGHKYEFMVESLSYLPPSQFDNGYVCSPSQLDDGVYRAPNSLNISISQLGTEPLYVDNPDVINVFEMERELRYVAESLYKQKGRYPSISMLLSESDKYIRKADTLKQLVNNSDIKYELLPKNCSSNCQDYVVSHAYGPIDFMAYSYNR